MLKSPGFVAGLSGLVMGLGQIFNGQVKKAIVFFLAQVGIFLYLWDFVGARIVADTLIGLTGTLAYHAFLTVLASGGLALWVFNIHDAYQTAQFLSFIFDRSAPALDDEEQEFVQASLNVHAMGMTVNRGASRKGVFIGVALLMYSAALLVLGARFSTTREERAMITAARENPKDPKARLSAGEWLLSRGEVDGARTELEESLKLAQALKDNGVMYRAYTSLARAYTELGKPDDANRCLKDALALYAPAASAETTALPEEQPEPASPAPSAAPSPAPLSDATATAVSFAVAQEENEHDAAAEAREAIARKASAPAAEEEPKPEPKLDTASRSALGDKPEVEEAAAPAPQGEPSELLSRALSNYKVKNYGESRRLLDAYQKRGPETSQSLALDGRLHAAVGDWDAAVEPLERAVEKGSVSVELEKLVAEALIRTGKTDAAVAHLRQALAKKPNDPETVLALSNLHRKAGRAPEARRLVEEALIEAPDHAGLLAADFGLALDGNSDEAAYQVAMKLLKGPRCDAQTARAMVTQAMDAQRLPLAHRLATACIQNNSAEPIGYILKGAVLVRQNEPRKAMQYFEKASGLGNQEPELFYEIATLYKSLGNSGRAIDSLKRASELAPTSATYARELAALQFKAGRYEEARSGYLLALRHAPGDLAARVGLGEALLRLGRTAEAKASFAAVLKSEPANVDARRWLAVAEAGERPEQTAAAVHGAVAVQPTDEEEEEDAAPAAKPIARPVAKPVAVPVPQAAPPIKGLPAPAAGGPGDAPLPPVDQAIQPTSQAEKRADETAARVLMGQSRGPQDEDLPKDVEKTVRDADAAYRSGDMATAEARYRAVLKARPASVHAHYQLGLIYRTRKEGAKAIVEMETARRLAPDDGEILLELGQIYTDSNVTARAITRLEDLVKLDPNNLAGRYTLGVNYEKAHRLDAAEIQYRAIEQKYPQFVQAHDYLGNLYFSQKRYTEAADQYGRLLASRPQDVRARFKKAVALFYLNQRDGAKQEFTQLARTLPANDPLTGKVQGYLGKL